MPRDAILIGQITKYCVSSPVAMQRWCDLMSELSDQMVEKFIIEQAGGKVTKLEVETITNKIPKVN